MKIKYYIHRTRNQGGTETIIFDDSNFIEKFSEKLGPHFTIVSDCKKYLGISVNGQGIHYISKIEYTDIEHEAELERTCGLKTE